MVRQLGFGIAMIALASGCGVEFDAGTDGSFTVELGDFNDACDLDATVYPIEEGGECLVEHELLSDQTTCQVSTVCTGAGLIDVEAISNEVDDATNSNENVRATVVGLKIALTDLQLSTTRPTISRFDLAADSVKDDPALEIINIGLQEVEQIEQGNLVEVFSAGSEDNPLITQLNDAIRNDEQLPVELYATVEVPLTDVIANFVGQDVEAEVDYAVDLQGEGSVCFFGCNR